jgi:KamA family protein
MMPDRISERPRYHAIGLHNITALPQWHKLTAEQQEALMTVGQVLPFRTNDYVVNELIDWNNIPDDPIFQLTFAQRAMLEEEHYSRVKTLLDQNAAKADIQRAANQIRLELNPHPAGQLTHNVPTLHGQKLHGLQHKYRETVLVFPAQGQTCHAYCTYCFRWAQFVGMDELKFQAKETEEMTAYLQAHPEVSDVLITGGDPLIMKTKVLRRYLTPLLGPDFAHIRTIRLGSKALAYWPNRFLADNDADDLFALFKELQEGGKNIAFMAHFSHPVELSTETVQRAIARLRQAGLEIRMQAPLVRHINDDPNVWAQMWREGVNLGLIPYYMFVERDTGPKNYFEVTLERAHQVFQGAYRQVSGLARTVRGPSMSAFPGKVRVLGISEVMGQKVFVLDLIQGRDPAWVRRPFFARYDPKAVWFSDLKPAFGERFFFEDTPERRQRPSFETKALSI